MSKDTTENFKTEIPQDELTNEISEEFKALRNQSVEDHNFNNVKTIFYYPKLNKDGELIGAGINHKDFIQVLNELGFYQYKVGSDFIFVFIENMIVQEVTKTEIQNTFIRYLDSLPHEIPHKDTRVKVLVRKSDVINNVYYANSTLFSPAKLSLLPLARLDLNKDTKERSFSYYMNGFVECDKEGYRLHPYTALQNHIWKKQIKARHFTFNPIKSIDEALGKDVVFARFMNIIANSNIDRLSSLCSIAGYLMHDFYDTDLKAAVLTDSSLSDVAEGRTGKGLFVKGLQQIRNLQDINGKDFKQDDKHKYQNLSLSTQIVHIDDVKAFFSIENLFNDITTGIKVEPKGKESYYIQAKMILTCNKTLNIQGSSARGRTMEFELADYFNDEKTPSKEFGHYFFADWDKRNEWEKFDNFMMFVISHYLRNGILSSAPINLVRRKVKDNTNPDFYDWVYSQEWKFNHEYDKKELILKFMDEYEEYKDQYLKKQQATVGKFADWLKKWASYNGYRFKDRSSNGKRWIQFFEK